MIELRNFKAPNSFYKEEIRCDVIVPYTLKKIWAVELDLYIEFARVCDKYNLQYYAFGGTLLGAIRHHGFIPWDDDIDVAMPIEDYKRLQQIAKDEFSSPYVLQTPILDPGSYFSFMKLRNKETTFMSKIFMAQHFNQGAFIDIFPLVECPPNKCEELRKKIYPSILRCSNYMKKGCEFMLNRAQLERFNKFQTEDPFYEYNLIQKEFENPDYKNCGYYTHASLFFDINKHRIWKSEWWEFDKLEDFECVKIPIPKGWNQILKEHYGDYLKLPKMDDRISIHSDMIIDMDHPYTDYII